jgi:hypothetical protein
MRCTNAEAFIKVYNALALIGAKKNQILEALSDEEGNSLVSIYKL